MKKVITSIILSLFISYSAFPCGNEYGHSVEGFRKFSRFFYLRPHHLKFDTGKLNQSIIDYDNRYQILKKGSEPIDEAKLLSNKALALMKLGRLKEAKEILIPLVNNFPEEYTMAANLGTVYELSGQLDSSLKYISKGLELNPNSHWGSEWIHVELLKAKIKRRSNKTYIIRNRILSKALIKSKMDSSHRFEEIPRILNNIYTQVKTRAAFTPAPNEVICNLLMSAGDYAKLHDTYENAILAYGYALKYAKGYDQNFKAKRAIKDLNKLKDKLARAKGLDRMFMRTIKRAELNPELLLMGLDEIAESLDSLNTVEINYKHRIDSLEAELNKPVAESVPVEKTEPIAPVVLKEEESNLILYVLIVLLSLSTLGFGFVAIKKRK